MMEKDGQYVNKFIRQTQYKVSEILIFDGSKRNKSTPLFDVCDLRNYRTAESYLDYAKDICDPLK